MSEYPKSDFSGQIDKIASYKKLINGQIKQLLEQGNSLAQVVSILGAEAFYGTIEGDKKKQNRSDVAHFDVKAFLDHQIESGTFLKLPDKITQLQEVILPPDEGDIITGSGSGFEHKELFPRNKAMMELLSDLNLQYEIIDGANHSNMMRNLSYRVYSVDSINKLLFVNDEEGNATYIIHLDSEEKSWKDFIHLKKSELNQLPDEMVRKVIFKGDIAQWKHDIAGYLTPPPFDSIEQKQKNLEVEENAPEGWYTVTGLATLLGVSFRIVKSAYDEIRSSPIPEDWIEMYKPARGQPREFLHPDFINAIIDRLSEKKPAPEGWFNKGALAEKMNVSYETAVRLVEKYKDQDLEWVKLYADSQGKMREYLHPDLVSLVAGELRKREKPPQGWMNRSGLAKKLKAASDTIDSLAQPYRSGHSEWFSFYTDPGGKVTEFYSPHLVNIIESEIQKKERPPEGWKNIFQMSRQFKVTFDLVQKILNEYRTPEHVEWFKEYYDKVRIEREYVHPDLVSIVEQKVKLMEHAPEGWMTISEMAKKHDIGYKVIQRLARSYTEQNPHKEWVKKYYNRINQLSSHLSPELIQLILQNRSK